MDNIILSKIEEIVNIIKNSDEYQKYIEVSFKMKNNKEIMSLIDEEINKKIEELEEYPIYLEYTYLQEDLNNSISLVKNSIENYINNITN